MSSSGWSSAGFNSNAPKAIIITIDPNYGGVAAAGGTRVTVGASYLNSHPKDVDLVNHEVMHLVQAYTGNTPGWAVEGLADYSRYRYGLYNGEGGWSLPNYSSSQNYTDSYRVTARFFVWLEQEAVIVPGPS